MKEKIEAFISQKYTDKELYFIKQILVFYAVGIVGFLLPFTKNIFTKLTPVALILSTILLVYFNMGKLNKKTIVYFVFVFIASFFIEVVGVKTGDLFGNYFYGNGLGVMIFKTPVLIGLNWVLMIYMSSAIFGNKSKSVVTQVIFTSLLMLSYDVVLEPAASKMNMWFWQGDKIPMQNFLMWGLVAVVFQLIKFMLKIEIKNKMALPLFVTQVFFFFLIQIF